MPCHLYCLSLSYLTQANRSARQPCRSAESLSPRSVWAVLSAFLTSAAVAVNLACFFANDWGIYTLLTEGPNFLSTVMREDIAAVRREMYKSGPCHELMSHDHVGRGLYAGKPKDY